MLRRSLPYLHALQAGIDETFFFIIIVSDTFK